MTKQELIEQFIEGATSGESGSLIIFKTITFNVVKSHNKPIAMRLYNGVIILNSQKYPKGIAEDQQLIGEVLKAKGIKALHSDEKTFINYHLNPLKSSKDS